MALFVSSESLPLVVEFNQDTAQKIFSREIKSHLLTPVLTIYVVFLTARTVLGPIADVGGTVFALLVLILLALLGGKLKSITLVFTVLLN